MNLEGANLLELPIRALVSGRVQRERGSESQEQRRGHESHLPVGAVRVPSTYETCRPHDLVLS